MLHRPQDINALGVLLAWLAFISNILAAVAQAAGNFYARPVNARTVNRDAANGEG